MMAGAAGYAALMLCACSVFSRRFKCLGSQRSAGDIGSIALAAGAAGYAALMLCAFNVSRR